MTAPLWVPLVVGGFGLVGTVSGAIGGVVITQRRSDRRETIAWERQREHERERWAREDAARTFEHRRAAYTDFYESLRQMALRAYDHGMGLADEDDEELPEGWQTDTFRRLQHLELYATAPVARAAGFAYSAVWQWGHNTSFGRDDDAFYEAQEEADAKERELLDLIRADLAIPGSDALVVSE